jgi:hypothetical protein
MRNLLRMLIVSTVVSTPAGAVYLNSLNTTGTPVVNGNDITLSTSGTAQLRVTLCSPGVARFWVARNGSFTKNPSFAIDTETWNPVSASINDKGT